MNVHLDKSKYDALQIGLTDAIIKEVDSALGVANLPPERHEEVVAAFVFHLCCLLDGSQEISGPHGPATCVLTFANGQDCSKVLSCGGRSWTHEYAHGMVEQYFDKKRQRPSQWEQSSPTMASPKASRPSRSLARTVAEAISRMGRR